MKYLKFIGFLVLIIFILGSAFYTGLLGGLSNIVTSANLGFFSRLDPTLITIVVLLIFVFVYLLSTSFFN